MPAALGDVTADAYPEQRPEVQAEPAAASSPLGNRSVAASAREERTVDSTIGGQRKKIDKQSLDYVLRTGLAGGLAGCAAKTIVGPLDRVKILFQASNPQFAKYTGSWFGVFTAMSDIRRNEGARGLFRGHSATLLRIFPYAAIKFLAYEQIRAVIITDRRQETPLRRLLSGSLAGVTSVFFTYPLEVIRVRLAFETRRDSRSSLSRICRQIYHEHAPLPVNPSSAMVSSSSSSSAASAINTTAAAVQRVTPRSGLANFYRGFLPTLLGMLPYAGMSFLTHDYVGDWLAHPRIAQYTTLPGPKTTTTTTTTTASTTDSTQYTRPHLTNTAELISGAVAGLVSQTASYPLEVIRRRMQVSGAVGDGKRIGMADTAHIIWAERGARGFFVGLGIGFLKVVPMVAVSFWTYERAKRALGV